MRVDTDEQEYDETGAEVDDNDATEYVEDDNTEGTEVDDATEADVTEGTDEDSNTDSATATATEQVTEVKPEGPTEEELNAAVQKFIAAVQGVVADTEGRDSATGVLSAELVSRVRTAYSDLPVGKARTLAKQYLDEKMRASMDKMEVQDARSYLQLKDNATKVSGSTATVAKAPVDPTEALVAQVAAMLLAPNTVVVPSGVAEDWQEKAKALARELQEAIPTYGEYLAEVEKFNSTDQPDGAEAPAEPQGVSPVVVNAYRIGRGRLTTGKRAGSKKSDTPSAPRVPSGTRRDVLAHIKNAFQGKNSGDFLLIAEIVNTQSTEYGNDKPSQGAVAARLFKKDEAGNDICKRFEKEGFEAAVNENGKKGARKL